MDAELDQLSRSIETFRVRGQRFLAGDLHVPPVELREEIRLHLRRLRSRAKGAAETFRLSSLEARFNSQHELFERRILQQETGVNARPSREVEKPPDPHDGVVIGVATKGAAVEALYRGLYEGPRPAIDLERFQAHLRRNVEIIRAKTGCREVLFRIATEDGKTKLKAKPLRAEAGA